MNHWGFRCVWFVKGYVYRLDTIEKGIRMLTLDQADKIEKLEKEHGWHEEEFDFILQFMRTILLKRMLAPFPNSFSKH